ncbi:MAG: malate dehydrogenase (quinone) [Nonlabens sp.]|uniref:malate dehydrogenase (quinone) n=1 Tax=Nonlabens sp. TaxID=1888209 RepID=UPI003EFB1476
MKNKDYDLICVGAGIMTATLALITKILKPELNILILERLDDVALESSAAWNNAGTGHSALCELNYCPKKDGSVDISKAIDICTQFEMSKQFWSYLVAQKLIDKPKSFINPVPHNSWVYGEDNTDYLEQRFQSLKEHFMFDSIEFTKSIDKMKEWFPLIMEDRDESDIMAGSRIERGAEMNFGALTKKLFQILESDFNVTVSFNKEVQDVDPDKNIEWDVITNNRITDETRHLSAHHVFIGAGGGSLLLLQKVEIEEKEGYGGFPVSGAWLVCKNEEIINQHHGKVYSKAGPNDPPMSTPHLDTRFINGKRELLFGPFAGFSPKFLKEGSYLDLFKSIKIDNIKPMLETFWDNLPLTQYLINQVTMSFDDRMDDLRKFYKNAKNEDWEYKIAGQRVQIIKKDEFQGGQLQFGTEVISSKDGSITCLLGASPGASTAVKIMLDVIEKAFPEIIENPRTLNKLQEIIPFYKTEVTKELFEKELQKSKELLEL